MSDAVFAKGTLIQIGDGSTTTGGETFTTLKEVRSITGPNFQGAPIDVTTHSTPGVVREKRAGLIDAGDLRFQLNYIPNDSQHAALKQSFFDQDVFNVQLVHTDDDTTTDLFSVQVTNFSEAAPVDNVYTADVSLTILTEPDFAIT